jgi:hypothetical protein
MFFFDMETSPLSVNAAKFRGILGAQGLTGNAHCLFLFRKQLPVKF